MCCVARIQDFLLQIMSLFLKGAEFTLALFEIMKIFCFSQFLMVVNNCFVKYEKAINAKLKKRCEKNPRMRRIFNGVAYFFRFFSAF